MALKAIFYYGICLPSSDAFPDTAPSLLMFVDLPSDTRLLKTYTHPLRLGSQISSQGSFGESFFFFFFF